jgi:hypothetical protein
VIEVTTLDTTMAGYVTQRLPFSQYDDRTRKIVLTSLVIDGITLASSGWLFLGIYRQGLKKLRTKLLLGMFLSNVIFRYVLHEGKGLQVNRVLSF